MIIPGVVAAVGGGGPPPYHADAVHFAGAASLLRIASLSCADSDFNSVSFWLKIATAQTDDIYTLNPLVGDNNCTFSGPNKLDITFSEQPAGDSANVTTPSNPATGAWHHVLVSFDTSAGVFDGAVLYLDDVLVDFGGNDFTATLNGTNFVMGELAGQNAGATFDISEFWFAANQNLTTNDGVTWTIPEATRRKFISAALKPVYLGANGELPTGVSPTIFFSGDATGYIINNGLGGAVTTASGITNAADSPSD